MMLLKQKVLQIEFTCSLIRKTKTGPLHVSYMKQRDQYGALVPKRGGMSVRALYT